MTIVSITCWLLGILTGTALLNWLETAGDNALYAERDLTLLAEVTQPITIDATQ